MDRKFSCISAWQGAGRSSEVSWLNIETLRWDYDSKAFFAPQPQASIGTRNVLLLSCPAPANVVAALCSLCFTNLQVKVTKVKTIGLMPGANQFCCFYTAFGDKLVCGTRYSETTSDIPWLHPDLRGPVQSGKKLGTYIKQLGSGRLQKYPVCQDAAGGTIKLPQNPMAAGLRTGVGDTLAQCMPLELAVFATGHSTKVCAVTAAPSCHRY